MIHLVQLLCPQRHCIAAVAFDPATHEAAQVKLEMISALKQAHINPWCGLCKSKDLHFETGATIYKTMEEATPALREQEAEQIKIAAMNAVKESN